MDSIHKDHRQRLRNQFNKSGTEGMSDYTLLELILFYAVYRKDTNPLAHRLIDRFGSFDKVFEADFDELITVEGVGEYVATYLTLFRDTWKRVLERRSDEKFSYDDLSAMESFIRAKYTGQQKEKAMLLHFNSRGSFVNYSWLGEGSFSGVVIENRQLAAKIVENKTAFAVLVHNHPSGIVNPSIADLEAIKKLSVFFRLMDVSVADSVIVSDSGIFFFSQSEKFYKYLF